MTPFLRARFVLSEPPRGDKVLCGNPAVAAALPMIGMLLLAWAGSASSAVASAASGAALMTLFPPQRTVSRFLLIVAAALSIVAFPITCVFVLLLVDAH